MRAHGKRLKRNHHRHRDDRRGHKYHRRSHSKSRSRSRSAEKPKMRALDVKSWKDFVSGGFQFDKFRRFKLDEAKELKDKERKSRTTKNNGEDRSDGKNQNAESIILTETEKSIGGTKLRYNLLDRKKEILKGLEVETDEADCTKDFPSYIIRLTKTKPVVKFSHNPAVATYHLQNRQQMLETLLPEIEANVHKFLSSVKPKKLKENPAEFNYNSIDDKLLLMMNNKNVYPFKGWWPKSYFIMTHVKEDPNIEIDKDALINAISTSKRTKKSRFEDDTSLTDLRPTVPSKWDSDYDGSPVIDKIVYSEISQNIELNTNNSVIKNDREKNNTVNNSHQEEPMDTTSDIGDDEPKIETNVFPIVSTFPQEPQVHAKLDTEYEEFLKFVSVKNTDENNEIPFLKDNENTSPIKSVSLNNNSVQDESRDDTCSKSSDESISLHNATEESIDRLSLDKSLSPIDKKLKTKNKVPSKKSKKLKKKKKKKKNRKSSSSESSQGSESESDSSSEDSESDTSDSISTVERKKKKKVSKDKMKKKSKSKKKHRSEKSKINIPVDKKEKIINLLQKALSAQIKQRPNENEKLKQKKKKRKHDKKIDDESRVSEVLKLLKIDEEKEKKKKPKKSSKRKFNSDDSSSDKSSKRAKIDNSSDPQDFSEKKKRSKKKKLSEKEGVELNDGVLKIKTKKKSMTSDSSETEDSKKSKHNKNKKEKDSKYFFGPRPNEWNKNKKSSMRGVVHHSVENFTPSTRDISRGDNENSKSLNIKHEHSCYSHDEKKNVCKDISSLKKDKTEKKLHQTKENIKTIEDDALDNLRPKIKKMSFNNSPSEYVGENKSIFENNKNLKKLVLFADNDVEQEVDVLKSSSSTKNNNNELQDSSEDQSNVLKLRQNKSPVHNDIDEPPVIILAPLSVPVGNTMSYRDKVKMNLKNLLSSCQNTPVGFVSSSSLGSISPSSFKIGETEENFKLNKEEKEQEKEDESKILCKSLLNNSDNMLTVCQDGPVGFVCSEVLGSTKPSNFEIGKIEDNFELNNEKFVKQQKEDELKILDSKLNKSSLVLMKKCDRLTDSTLPKIDLEVDNQVTNHSFNWEDSEDSSHHSSVKSVNIVVHLSNEEESTQIKSSLLENRPSNINIKNNQYKHETLSDDSIVKVLDHSFEPSETSFNNLDIETQKEFQLNLDVENSVKENATVYKNYNESMIVTSIKKKYLDSSSQSSSIDLDVFKNDNELITQWESDWSKLIEKSDTNIYDSDNRSDDNEMLLLKKESRWDKQPKSNEVNEQYSDGQIELENNASNYTTDTWENSNPSLIVNESLDEQNEECEIPQINYMNDGMAYEYCSENWNNDYESYNQYSCTPQYSEMKTLGDGHLSPVDYSIYENYNPNYNYQGENYDKWNAFDTSYDLTAISTIDKTLTSSQVENGIEMKSSEEGVKQIVDVVQNDDILPVQDVQNKTQEKLNSIRRDELFFQLYQQYVKHYSQNPIKYSMSDILFDIDTNVNPMGTCEEVPDNNKEKKKKKIAIPLQERAYVCVVEDNNTNVYLTNDNYIAYCAVKDKCMVHIALETCSRDDIQDQVRHCFNINQNGTVVEYWLHADLIPFYSPSDGESGVFSDDEEDSTGSGSGQEDNVDENESGEDDDSDDDIIKGEWEIIDSDSDDIDDWLNDPSILKKYGEENNINIDGVRQTVTDINREDYVLPNSPEYDSEISGFSDSDINTKSACSSEKQNIIPSPTQSFSLVNINETQDFDIISKQTDINVINSDLPVNIDSNLMAHNNVLSVESKFTDYSLETSKDPTSDIKTENTANSWKSNKDGNEPGVFQKEELQIEELVMMNNIINQQMLIQRLKIQAKDKIQDKLPDTAMFSYSDNMEIIKHPFLGLFRPPTNSILIKQPKVKVPGVLRLVKRVTFADGINPGTNLAESPRHDDHCRPLSPIPLKALLRETLKLKCDMKPFTKSKKKITKLKMESKKVAKVTPIVKTSTSSNVKYYVSQRVSENLPVLEPTVSNCVEMSEDSPLDSDDDSGSVKIGTPPSLTRDVTPVPSDNETWNDNGNNVDDD